MQRLQIQRPVCSRVVFSVTSKLAAFVAFYE